MLPQRATAGLSYSQGGTGRVEPSLLLALPPELLSAIFTQLRVGQPAPIAKRLHSFAQKLLYERVDISGFRRFALFCVAIHEHVELAALVSRLHLTDVYRSLTPELMEDCLSATVHLRQLFVYGSEQLLDYVLSSSFAARCCRQLDTLGFSLIHIDSTSVAQRVSLLGSHPTLRKLKVSLCFVHERKAGGTLTSDVHERRIASNINSFKALRELELDSQVGHPQTAQLVGILPHLDRVALRETSKGGPQYTNFIPALTALTSQVKEIELNSGIALDAPSDMRDVASLYPVDNVLRRFRSLEALLLRGNLFSSRLFNTLVELSDTLRELVLISCEASLDYAALARFMRAIGRRPFRFVLAIWVCDGVARGRSYYAEEEARTLRYDRKGNLIPLPGWILPRWPAGVSRHEMQLLVNLAGECGIELGGNVQGLIQLELDYDDELAFCQDPDPAWEDESEESGSSSDEEGEGDEL